MDFHKPRSYWLVIAGLLGIAGYPIVDRLVDSSILGNDFLHGTWVGVCLGTEMLGLYLIHRAKQ